MYNFEYVDKVSVKSCKKELIDIIHQVQDEVRKYFTFSYQFVGSCQRNMITCDNDSNIGFDFDVNIEVNDDEENYSAKEIRNILRNAIDSVTHNNCYYGYDCCEDSTRVLTIKVKDKYNSRIEHSCDFCIVHNSKNGQQYIRYNKKQNYYSWEWQGKSFQNLDYKIDWLKKHKLWNELRNYYLNKKNFNLDKDKHSRSLFAEAVHEIYQKNKGD